MRWRSALLVFAGVVCALVMATPGLAGAHATLVSSVPADDSRVANSPSQVALTFDENISVGADPARVISAQGDRVDTGTPHLTAAGNTLVIPVRPDLPAGSYSATWRVISADTHVVTGSIVFGVRADPGAPAPAAPPVAASVTALDRASQALLYAGLVGSVGLAVVSLMLYPGTLALKRFRWTVAPSWVLAVLACAGTVLVRAAEKADVGVGQALSGSVLSSGLDGGDTRAVLIRSALVVVLGLVLFATPRRRVPEALSAALIGACGLGVAVTVAADGHASVGDLVWLAMPVTILHVVAMTLWLGGLLSMVLILLSGNRSRFPATVASKSVASEPAAPEPSAPELLTPAVLHRWSRWAFTMVVVLVLSGEFQAWRQIWPVQALWDTTYGVVLLVKSALVLAMLGLAAYARRRLGLSRLRRSMPLEMACGIAVLVVTSVLVTEPPARTTYGPPVQVAAPLDDGSAQVSVSTTRRGPTVVDVTLDDGHGTPIRARSLRATLSSESAGIPSLALRFVPAQSDTTDTGSPGSARWHSVAASVPVAGAWTLTLTVQFSDTDARVTTVGFVVW
ncbi:copper resistance protein CopC [Gordonia sp. N1V]|uniref:copper resistance CopC/CopD family protein n=1 Tax=Gordonia sp. N1V TaxID=3034163 RepID=UPI0023E23511|nr:copper resistance protein CopC [Gordonia sp. N1V]MDF3283406.1 copper resistance protein CopC [Gordonia sp. N1V]